MCRASFATPVQNHTHKPILFPVLRPGHILALIVLALLCLGLVMVTSAGMRIEPIAEDGSIPTSMPRTIWDVLASGGAARSLVYLSLALLAITIASRMPIRRALDATRHDPAPRSHAHALRILALATLALLAILALVYIPGLAPIINGARRWLRIPIPGIGDVSIQVSEIAKWAMVFLLAAYAAMQGPRLRLFLTGLTPALIALGLVCAMIILEDLGTAALIAAVGVLILWAGGARLAHFLAFAPAAVAGLIAAVWFSPYRVARLLAFLDPYADPQGIGYHMIQSMRAVAAGEVAGQGLGFGLQKHGYLPEDTTDFLFAVICEELGVAGAVLVVALFLGLLTTGLWIMRKEPTVAGRLLTLGILATVGLQAAINLIVVTGLGPTKGIALPLVSAGGTGWILTAASIGLLIALDRDHAVPSPHLSVDTSPTSSPTVREGFAGCRGHGSALPRSQPTPHQTLPQPTPPHTPAPRLAAP